MEKLLGSKIDWKGNSFRSLLEKDLQDRVLFHRDRVFPSGQHPAITGVIPNFATPFHEEAGTIITIIVFMQVKHYYPLFFFLFFFPFQQLHSQTRTIINTEKGEPDPNKGLHGSLNATGSAATGNIELLDINADGMLGYREPQYWLRLLGGSTFFKQDGIKSIDNNYGQLRFSRFFGDRKNWQSYSFAQFQSNYTLILKERGIVGTGIRRSFPFRDTGHFDLGAGVMWEYELLDGSRLKADEKKVHRDWRFTSVLVFRKALGKKVSILNTAYVQPKVSDLDDIRALDELSLLTRLTEHFQFDVTFYWRTDTEPPEAIVPSDFGVDLGVLLEV